MTRGRWQVTGDRWQVTCDRWQVASVIYMVGWWDMCEMWSSIPHVYN